MSETTTTEETWSQIKKAWHESADEKIGTKPKQKKETWISEETLKLADDKRLAKAQGNEQRYRSLKAETQQSVRRDKNTWLACEKIDKLRSWNFGKRQAKREYQRNLSSIAGRQPKRHYISSFLQIWRNNESGRPKNSSPFVNQVQRKIVQTTEPCHW